MKGAWSGHTNHLNFGRHQRYPWNGWTAEARVVKFCIQVDYIKSELSVNKASLKEALPGSRDDPFLILAPIVSLESVKLGTANAVYWLTRRSTKCAHDRLPPKAMYSESHALYRMAPFSVTLGDPYYPETTPISTFCLTFHIFVVRGDRQFKLNKWVYRSKC